jgi:hypothetical protein
MLMQRVDAFAEYEHAMIRVLTSTGLVDARVEGCVGGRRKARCEQAGGHRCERRIQSKIKGEDVTVL